MPAASQDIYLKQVIAMVEFLCILTLCFFGPPAPKANGLDTWRPSLFVRVLRSPPLSATASVVAVHHGV